MATTTPRTRKAPAKGVAAPAKKGVAAASNTKAPAEKAATPKPAAEKRYYTATARSGQVVKRQSASKVTHAVDVAEPTATSAKAKLGRIWSMFGTKEAAQVYADKLNGQGLDAVVTTAKPV